jgi:hypothetical protein
MFIDTKVSIKSRTAYTGGRVSGGNKPLKNKEVMIRVEKKPIATGNPKVFNTEKTVKIFGITVYRRVTEFPVVEEFVIAPY